MAQGRPQGRRTTTGAGGGNATRRGSGLGTGRVGRGGFGGSSGSSGSGSSGGFSGGSRPPVFTGGNRGGGNRSLGGGCLGKILLLVAVIALIGYFGRSCLSGSSGLLSGLTGGAESPSAATSASSVEGTLMDLLSGGYLTNSYTYEDTAEAADSTSSAAYTAHAADTASVSAGRGKFTQLRGGGDDTVTIMVFMCATDLESQNGMATADLVEMTHASFSDNVNLIVETGGTTKWNNSVIQAGTNQIYKVSDGGLTLLEKSLGKKSMTDPDTLSAFIQYCKKNYPADRYGLIFWNHGGGSISGYGYDLLYPSDSMTLDEIGQALTDGGCKFDFVGFDACLMGSLETALVAEPHADYLIASEATEPGCGWYYTDWLTSLSKNPSMSTVQLGKEIIDDFVSVCAKKAASSKATLSILDLSELSGTLAKPFTAFSAATAKLIDGGNYAKVSTARSGARDFSASSPINQIDLIHFLNNLGTDEAAALTEVLESAVKYNRTSTNISNANGVSIYFPYQSLGKVGSALSTYDRIGMDETYTDCIRSFASVAAGGQAVSAGTGSSGSPLDVLLGQYGGSSPSGDLLGSLLGSSQSSGGSLAGELLGSLLTGGSSSQADTGTAAIGSLLDLVLGGSASSGSSASDILSWLDADRVRASASYYSENLLTASDLVPTVKNGERVLALTDEQWALVGAVAMNAFVDDGEGYIDLGCDNAFRYNLDDDLILDSDGTWLSLSGQIVAYYLESEDWDGDRYTFTGYVPLFVNGERAELVLTFTSEDPDGHIAGYRPYYDAADTDMAARGLTQLAYGDRLDFLCDYYSYQGVYQDSYYLGEQMTVTQDLEIYNAEIGADTLMTCRITDLYGNVLWTQPVHS